MSMMRMNVTVEMPIREIDGEEPKGGDPHLVVKSHWNRTSDLVVLYVSGHKYTVEACALRKAVERATGF
jgi:hypothetical protein